MLSTVDRKDLVYAMKYTILEQVRNNPDYFGSNLLNIVNFISEDITYEQLLNLTFNTRRDENYLQSDLLENVAVLSIVNELKKIFELNRSLSESSKNFDKLLTEDTENYIKSTIEKLYESISFNKSDLIKYTKWAALGISAVVGAAFLYKKFVKKFNNQCKDKQGIEYTRCITDIKIKAHTEVIKVLEVALHSCETQVKNVESCKKKFLKEIKNRKEEIKKLKEKRL